MPKFPLPAITLEPSAVTVARSVKALWPFVAGFSTTAYIFIKVAASVTDEDVKNSTFTNPKH